MAKPDSHDDDYSFLPTVEDSEVLSKEELWQRAKEQTRKRQPAPPAPPTKDELWAQAKGRKANIRRLDPAPAPQPEPAPVEEPQADEWQQTLVDAYGLDPDLAVTDRLDRPDEAVEQPQMPVPIPAAPVSRRSIYETAEPAPLPPEEETEEVDEPTEPEVEQNGEEEEQDESEEASEPRVIRLGDTDTPARELTRKEKFAAFWANMGGKSLTFSLVLHASIILVAGLIVFTTVHDPQIDFMPGGGTEQGDRASQELEATVQKKRMPWAQKTPMRRLAIADASSALQLPDDVMDIPMPDVGSMLDSSKMGAFGFGSSGAGGGFGNGIGTGGRGGVTFKPISMFGFNLKGKKLSVVLDVSGSMLDELPKVVREADKVAQGSVIICYYGCGLARRQGTSRLPERAQSTSSGAFRNFWSSMYDAPSRGDTSISTQVFEVLQKRRNTYFIDVEDTKYSWLALLADELMSSDTVYWFSDFLDQVEDDQIKLVLENMKRRKQRLYVQNIQSYEGIKIDAMGAFFQKVRHQLVIPTGGEVVEPVLIQK